MSRDLLHLPCRCYAVYTCNVVQPKSEVRYSYICRLNDFQTMFNSYMYEICTLHV